MARYTKQEAVAFIDATRLTLEGKVGFKWLVEKLSALSAYIEEVADENEVMREYLDSAGLIGEYERFRAASGDRNREDGDDREK